MLLHDIYQRQTGLEELLPPVRFHHLAKLCIENKCLICGGSSTGGKNHQKVWSKLQLWIENDENGAFLKNFFCLEQSLHFQNY